MKRKRGSGKRKPKLAAVVGAIAKEAVQNIVSLNPQDDWGVDDFDNAEFDSRMEIEPQNVSSRTRQRSGSRKQKVVDATVEDGTTSFRESSIAVSASQSKRARSIMTKSSEGFTSASMKLSKNAEQTQDERTKGQATNLPHNDPDCKEEELKAALAVIRKVMKMDAAEPFNVPVDPIALGIPDYFDVIDTPMDFGTICNNLEKGVKYKNSENVLRDVQFIWDNCCKYNKKGHYILELMKRVKKNFTKLWTEAGLEQQEEADGYPHLPCMEYTTKCSNHGNSNPLGSIAKFARHQHQDPTDLTGLRTHQPSLCYSQTYQHQHGPCQCHNCSLPQRTSQRQDGRSVGNTVNPVHDNSTHQFQHQQHYPSLGYSQPHQSQYSSCQCHSCSQQSRPSHQQTGTSFTGAGLSHFTPLNSTMRPSPSGHRCAVRCTADNPTHLQQNQGGSGQTQNHQHWPSVSCSQSYQPQQVSCQACSVSVQQQPSHRFARADTVNTDLHSPPPEESMIRCPKRAPKCSMGPTDDYISNQQQDQIGGASHIQSHQPSSCHGQQHLAQHGICKGRLSPSQLHPSCGEPQPAQQHVSAENNSADLHSPPPEESMIRCPKRVPKCPVDPMTDYISNQQQDHIGCPSHMQSHQPSARRGQRHLSQHGIRQGQLSSSQRRCSCGEPQSSQQHVSEKLDSAEEQTYSPPVDDSMLRCTEHVTKSFVGPMTHYISCQEQDQTTPNTEQPRQQSLNYGHPDQTQEVASDGLPSSGLPQPSQPLVPVDMGSADSSSTKKRGRGPTRCLDVWNTRHKISIPTNELGQPIGPKAPKLTTFLGTIARDGHLIPLNYINWRAIPDEKKEHVWELVQSKFDIDPNCKSWVLKSAATKWKNWKALLKASRYNPHQTDEERLADLDERVLPDQWRILVSFWNSKEAMDRSLKNKTNRAKQKLCHFTGTKSFARVREEEREKRPDGKEPSRADLFILTRTRKDGKPVNEETSRVISQLREKAAERQGTPQVSTIDDDVFFQVMGEDRHGRVRTYGLGPVPSDLAGPKPSQAEAMKMVSEANVEVREMKVKMEAMEETCAQMAAQMAAMMSMMSTMHAKFPDKNLSNTVASHCEPPRAGLGADVSVASEGSQPLQKSVSKGGKKQNTSISKVAHKRR